MTSKASAVMRKPLIERTKEVTSHNDGEGGMTVVEFLEEQCVNIVADLRAHGKQLQAQLRKEYAEQAAAINEMMKQSANKSKTVCINLRCTVGAHMGQKFRLEPENSSGEDVFKIGRSTGKAFRQKGVSLYKDKEVSTTHAKLELRGGQVFFTDLRSTNGSSVNDKKVEAQCPQRVCDGDVLQLGGSEFVISVSEISDEQLDDVVSF